MLALHQESLNGGFWPKQEIPVWVLPFKADILTRCYRNPINCWRNNSEQS